MIHLQFFSLLVIYLFYPFDDSMIDIHDVSKKFGDTQAVSHISFQVNEGEIVGLLGPNGAGKTTTMRMITGYLSPDSGMISASGIDVINHPVASQKNIGYMPENNPLYKEMLVSEMLSFAGHIRLLTNDQLRDGIAFAVNATNIHEVYNKPINELSKGFKQRVGMAVALLHRPKILILDEPTEGLDPNQRTDVRNLIRDLGKDHTIIVSTHVMQEIEAVATRLIIINKGTVVADGSPSNLTRGSGKIQVVIEGEKIVPTMKKMHSVSTVTEEKTIGKKHFLTVMVKAKTFFQPELMAGAVTNKWIIWELTEQKSNLESVFHALTSKGVV